MEQTVSEIGPAFCAPLPFTLGRRLTVESSPVLDRCAGEAFAVFPAISILTGQCGVVSPRANRS